MRKHFALPVAFTALLAVAACTAQQIQTAQTDIGAGITAACQDVNNTQAAVAKAAPSNAKVASLVGYAAAACPLGIAAASLVQNSATLEWLGNLQGQLSAAAPAAAPAPAATPASAS